MSVLTDLLSNNGYIIVNKLLIKKLGLECAILIGELCSEYSYWEKQNKLKDGFFYSTRENILNNTGLSSYHQRNATEKLIKSGILVVKFDGVPQQRWYSVNIDKLYEVLK